MGGGGYVHEAEVPLPPPRTLSLYTASMRRGYPTNSVKVALNQRYSALKQRLNRVFQR